MSTQSAGPAAQPFGSAVPSAGRRVEYSAERLQQLDDFFENAPVGLQITGPDGAIRRANLAALDLVGCLDAPGELMRRRFTEFVTDAAVGQDLLDRAATGEILNDVALRLVRRDGTPRDVIADVSARFEDGRVVALRWFLRPRLSYSLPRDDSLGGAPDAISPTGADGIWGAPLVRVAPAVADGDAPSEAESRRLFAELDDFFENAPAGVHFVGFNGLILRANVAELRLLGYDAEPSEYVGRHVRTIHSNKALVEDLLYRLVQGKPVINFRARLIRKDGALQPVIIYSGLRLKDGRFENTRCFLFADPTPPAQAPRRTSFRWPRNEED
jgi:PAS domain S-box-containing protein